MSEQLHQIQNQQQNKNQNEAKKQEVIQKLTFKRDVHTEHDNYVSTGSQTRTQSCRDVLAAKNFGEETITHLMDDEQQPEK